MKKTARSKDPRQEDGTVSQMLLPLLEVLDAARAIVLDLVFQMV